MKTKTSIFILCSFAIVLGILEILILPTSIFPFIKLGLANIVTLIVLIKYGYKYCVLVVIFRVIVVSLVTGSLFTPTFLISLLGAIFGLIFLYFGYICNIFSIVGISVLSALGNNIGQMVGIYFITNALSILSLIPFLMYLAIFTGIINGLVGLQVLKRIRI